MRSAGGEDRLERQKSGYSRYADMHRRHECAGENDVFAGTVHDRSGGLPECVGCKRG